MNGLTRDHCPNFHRDEGDDRVEVEGGVQRLLEIVELSHSMDGVEQVLTLLLKILRSQKSGRGQSHNRRQLFEVPDGEARPRR